MRCARSLLLLAGALLLLGLSACAEEPSAEEPSAEEPSAEEPSAERRAAGDSIAAQPDTLSVARTDTVRVVLSEFDIKMPASLRAGRTIFRVRNAGKRRHSFELERDGTAKTFEGPPAPRHLRGVLPGRRPRSARHAREPDRGRERHVRVSGAAGAYRRFSLLNAFLPNKPLPTL